MSAATPHGACIGILLAAGHGRRFGNRVGDHIDNNKLLHPLADRRPLALVSALTLRAAIPDLLAVVQSDNTALQARFDQHGIPWLGVRNDGMGDSLAAAVAATRQRVGAGWVVALADMPFLQPATIATVAAAIEAGAPLAAPTYRGARGHPVGMAARFADDLAALRGDEGARTLLQTHAAALQHLPTDDPGTLHDIDTPDDLPPAYT